MTPAPRAEVSAGGCEGCHLYTCRRMCLDPCRGPSWVEVAWGARPLLVVSREEEEGQLLVDVCEPGGWVPVSTPALAPRGKEVSSHLPGSFSADSAFLPHAFQDRERREQERPRRKTWGRSLLPKCQLGSRLPPTVGAGVNHPGFWMAHAHAVDRGAGISMRQPRLADAEVNSWLCWRDLS